MENKATTIYDIAERLGLSASTVNRALNSSSAVKRETRELVLKTAAEMNYRANPMARGLKRRALKIGFIVNECASEFQIRVLEGAREAWNDIRTNSDFNLEAELCVIPRGTTLRSMVDKLNEMIDGGCDGVVFSPASVYGYEKVLKRFRERGIPVATVTSDIDSDDILFTVRSNARLEGAIAADLMHLTGVREGDQVVVFTGRSENMGNRELIDSFLSENKKYGFAIEAILDHQDDNEWARDITDRYFSRDRKVKAVYISTPVAVPILKILKERNLLGTINLVTSDISAEIKEYLEEDLITGTLIKSAEKQGRMAFTMMYQYLSEGKSIPRNIFIKPKVVIRANRNEY